LEDRNFIINLVLIPGQAIVTIQKKWSPTKTGIIFVLTFFMLAVNYFLVNFTGNVLNFFFTLGMVFGIVMETMLLLLNLLFLWLLLKLGNWSGKAREFTKTASWLIMVPALIYYLIAFPIFLVLRLALQEGPGIYLYKTAKCLMYFWIISLLTVAVTKDQKETRISSIAAVILSFALTYIMVVAVNYTLVSLVEAGIQV